MLKNYNDYIVEKTSVDDIGFIINDILSKNVPTSDIIEFRDDVQSIIDGEKINESITTEILKLKSRFSRWFDDQIFKYLINRKKKFYVNLIDKLNIFDITSLDDVFKNHPGLKIESIYLAGGMDKAKDVGAGWRIVVENEFEGYPGKQTDLPQIDLKEFGSVVPKRVVDGEYLNMFLENPNKTKKLYDKPLLLNPVRKEVDRTKNPEFMSASRTYKTFGTETQPEEYEPTFTDIRKTLSTSIEPDDEHLIRIADLILLGFNTAAAAGTYGELQTQSLMNKPIFVWMTDQNWSLSDFSMWSIPHFSKFCRTEDEMKILVNTIMRRF